MTAVSKTTKATGASTRATRAKAPAKARAVKTTSVKTKPAATKAVRATRAKSNQAKKPSPPAKTATTKKSQVKNSAAAKTAHSNKRDTTAAKLAKRDELLQRARKGATDEDAQANAHDQMPGRVQLPGPGEIFGQAAWLMMMSQTHKHLFIGDMEWLLTPPIMLKQFRIWRNNNIPFAFASWARLNEESEQRLLSGNRRLSPADWNNGDKAWLIDLVCPHGDPEPVLRDLKENVFSNDPLMTLRPDSGGKGVIAVEVEIEGLQSQGE